VPWPAMTGCSPARASTDTPSRDESTAHRSQPVSGRTVQTLYRAVRIEGLESPHDTAHVAVHYPARVDVAPVDAIGTRTPDVSNGVLPIVVFFGGINMVPSYYRWLAAAIAECGFAFVTFGLVGQVPPNEIGYTPAADIDAVRPDTFGSRPVARVLPTLLALMSDLNEAGPLTGSLDLDNIALGGHSAGGTIALESADHHFFPAVRAVFAYAAHTMASTIFGWPQGTVLPLSGDCPVLLLTGTADGLVAASAKWYGEGDERVDPILRTFQTLPDTSATRGSWLVQVNGANHFAIASPQDGGWPRGDVDLPLGAPAEGLQAAICQAIGLFLTAHLRDDPVAATSLTDFLRNNPLTTATSNSEETR
jgi:dienelactone hydrolase